MGVVGGWERGEGWGWERRGGGWRTGKAVGLSGWVAGTRGRRGVGACRPCTGRGARHSPCFNPPVPEHCPRTVFPHVLGIPGVEAPAPEHGSRQRRVRGNVALRLREHGAEHGVSRRGNVGIGRHRLLKLLPVPGRKEGVGRHAHLPGIGTCARVPSRTRAASSQLQTLARPCERRGPTPTAFPSTFSSPHDFPSLHALFDDDGLLQQLGGILDVLLDPEGCERGVIPACVRASAGPFAVAGAFIPRWCCPAHRRKLLPLMQPANTPPPQKKTPGGQRRHRPCSPVQDPQPGRTPVHSREPVVGPDVDGGKVDDADDMLCNKVLARLGSPVQALWASRVVCFHLVIRAPESCVVGGGYTGDRKGAGGSRAGATCRPAAQPQAAGSRPSGCTLQEAAPAGIKTAMLPNGQTPFFHSPDTLLGSPSQLPRTFHADSDQMVLVQRLDVGGHLVNPLLQVLGAVRHLRREGGRGFWGGGPGNLLQRRSRGASSGSPIPNALPNAPVLT